MPPNANPDLSAVAKAIAAATGAPFTLPPATRSSSGTVVLHNASATAAGALSAAFVKLAPGRPASAATGRVDALPPAAQPLAGVDALAAEADSLVALAAVPAGPRVPRVLCTGPLDSSGAAFLALEYVPLAPLDDTAGAELGRALARLHRAQSPSGQHGWERDTMLGHGRQLAGWRQTWTDCFRQLRLAPQLAWAAARGREVAGGDVLLERVDSILDAHDPAPSLLHGDLWSGNAGRLAKQPRNTRKRGQQHAEVDRSGMPNEDGSDDDQP